MMGKPWSAERNDELVRLHASGLGPSAIAREMGLSKNAVLGRMGRIGLKSPPRPRATDETRRLQRRAQDARYKARLRARKEAAKQQVGATAPILPAPAVAAEPHVSRSPVLIWKLKHDSCRWPLWEDRERVPVAKQRYCGRKALPGVSWCSEHCRMAYQRGTRHGVEGEKLNDINANNISKS